MVNAHTEVFTVHYSPFSSGLCEPMADDILVFAEYQAGKVVRPTWEAIAAGQRLAEDIGGSVSAVILGDSVSALAAELAAAELAEVLKVQSPWLGKYTPDGYALALRQVLEERKPGFVL